MNPLTVLIGDCRETLKNLPDESVQCCVTSPPYWGLRDYGTAKWEGGEESCDHNVGIFDSKKGHANGFSGHDKRPGPECGKCGAKRIDAQLGLEKTPEEFVTNMTAVFREVHRVLRSDGTLWLNMGDCYNGTGNRAPNIRDDGTLSYRAGGKGNSVSGLKAKDMVGVPWMLAFALRADGWYLRQWMPWVKRNAMPESVTDRPATSCETFFLLTKSPTYFYDGEAVKMPSSPGTHARLSQNVEAQIGSERANGGRKTNGNMKAVGKITVAGSGVGDRNRRNGDWFFDSDWQGMFTDDDGWPVAMMVNPVGYKGAHFATFPPKLIAPCIAAGTSSRGCCPTCGTPWTRIMDEGEPDLEWQRQCGGDANGEYHGENQKAYQLHKAQPASTVKERVLAGMKKRRTLDWEPGCKCGREDTVPCVVLDPFGGSGTTGKVAIESGRHVILCELNPEYGKLIDQRTETTLGLAL